MKKGFLKKITAYNITFVSALVCVVFFAADMFPALHHKEVVMDRDNLIKDEIYASEAFEQKYKNYASGYATDLANGKLSRAEYEAQTENLEMKVYGELAADTAFVEEITKDNEEVQKLNSEIADYNVLPAAIMGVGGFAGAMGNVMVMSILENRERKKNQTFYVADEKKKGKKKEHSDSEEEIINVPYEHVGLE